MAREFVAMKKLESEYRLNLKQARAHFPWEPDLSTIYRYVRRGIWSPPLEERIYLEAYREGRFLITSVEAIQRFRNRLNGAEE